MKGIRTILFVLLLFFIDVTLVRADFSGTVPSMSYGSGNNSSSSSPTPPTQGQGIPYGVGRDGYTYTCNYSYYIHSSRKLNIDVRDKEGNDLIPHNATVTADDKKVKAGTYVLANVSENVDYWYEIVDVSVVGTKEICTTSSGSQTCVCTVRCKNGDSYSMPNCNTSGSNSNCSWSKNCVTRSGTRRCSTNTKTDNSRKDECMNDAIAVVKEIIEKKSVNTNYKLELTDPNKIDGAKKKINSANCRRIGWTSSTKYRFSCEYLSPKVCMNVETGKVTYKDTGDCDNNEKIVSNIYLNGKNFFHYFIPLNAVKKIDPVTNMINPNTNVYLSVIRSGVDTNLYPLKTCQAAIKDPNNKNNYQAFLVYRVGATDRRLRHYGSSDLAISNALSEISTCTDKEKCCYVAASIEIDYENKFYKVNNDNKIDGLNFYYRPVNENNPFPNGISENSFWKNHMDYDFANSFAEKTYVSTSEMINHVPDSEGVIAHGEVLADNLKYFDWSNMNANGMSDLINNFVNVNTIASRENVPLKSIAPLGTGLYIKLDGDKFCVTSEGISKGKINTLPRCAES